MPDVRELVDLSAYTTLRLGGPAARFAEASTSAQIIAGVREADRSGQPLLVLGGGSNLVIADEGFAGTVIHVTSQGIAADGTGDRIRLQVQAGENWAELVDWAVADKLTGIECLAGIPGLAGATPIQNVGAYSQEVAQVIESVLVFDRRSGRTRTLSASGCRFGYRTSIFKQRPAEAGTSAGTGTGAGTGPTAGQRTGPTGRYIVLAVTLVLERGPMSAPIRYPELAAALGVRPGERVPLEQARDAVLGLRRGKGMVLDPADPDTRSAGSFFTNPVLNPDEFARLRHAVAERIGPQAVVPHFPAPSGRIKIPAAWLIEQAGFAKGYPGSGAARISAKHTLALTNAAGASTAGLMELAAQIRAGVQAAFGIELANEPVLVGVTW